MEIESFQWDEANEEKIGRRGYTYYALDSVLTGRTAILRNKRGHAGTHRVIGRAADGELVTIIVRWVQDGEWRPVNAWPCDAEERAYAKRYGI